MVASTDVRNPLFARLYHHVLRRAEGPSVARCRKQLVEGLGGTVLEVGAGDGANFPHYSSAVGEVIAIEPEPYLRARAGEAAAKVPADVRVVGGDGDHLPAADGSVDAVVYALVLCSVPDQARALAEVRRVLRPGGELRLLEHVRAEHRVARRAQQVADATFWPRCFGGCHLTRDTLTAVRNAGFDTSRVHRFVLRGEGEPPMAYILGTATPAA
ncbi:MAG: class I SAM-dependent methyltransferase [Solirubrobacteraceae bacterium]